MLSKTVLKTSLLVYFLLKHVTFDFVALFTGSYRDLPYAVTFMHILGSQSASYEGRFSVP